MIRFAFLPIVFSLCACGAKGTSGPTGVAGAAGAQGAQGAAGVCDLSSCPQVSSIDGLSGGTIHGAANFPDSVTLSRVVLTKGTVSTSTNAFFCGATAVAVPGSATNGNVGGDADVSGPWLANKECQTTCASSTAHVCTSLEFIKFQALRGWTDGGTTESSEAGSNHGVPMPLASPTPPSGFDRGWIYAADGVSSCQGFSTDSASVNGVVFKPGAYGYFLTEACSATHPLYCCD